MSRRDNKLLLQDMLEGAEKILRYTKGMHYDDFVKNELVIDAVARNFEIIGEAANRVTPDFKTSNHQIDGLGSLVLETE